MAIPVSLKKKNKSILDYAFTVGSRGANRLLTLLISIIIARSLGVEQFGIYSLFFGLFILLFQAQSGVNIAYVRYTKLKNDCDSIILRLSLKYQLAVVAILITAGWPFAYFINNILEIDDFYTIYFGIVCSGLLGVFGITFGIYQAKGQFLRLGVLTLLFNLLIFIVVVVAYIVNIQINLKDILYLYISFAIMLCVLSLLFLWKKSEPTNDTALAKEFYHMILINVLITLLYFSYRYIDVYFIKYYSDLQSVGVYSAAMKTSMLLNILTGALPTILLPKAVSAIKNKKSLSQYLKKSLFLVSAIILFFCIFIIYAPAILAALFGEEYTSASYALQILVAGWMLNTAYIPIVQLLYALNKSGWRLMIESVKLIIAVLAFMLLIPEFGGVGAAYALLISIAIALLLSIIVTYKQIVHHFNAVSN